MKRYAADMMDGKNIIYEIQFPDKVMDIKLEMSKRKDLYFIFKEAVNNLIKYSYATNVNILITIQHNKLLLHINDNGKGFDIKNTAMGNGIENMQHRANSLKATLKLESQPGVGTDILLRMNIH